MRIHLGDQLEGTPYRVDGWIGEGGMGTVYRATHLELQRPVALKVLHPELLSDEGEVAQFRDEARAASKIGSPYIVDVFDFLVLPDDRRVLVLELLEGVTLHRRLRDAPLPPGEVIGLLRQACKGLGAAHAAGIIHRDVKPGNIFLCNRGDRRQGVKLLDFGAALATTGEALVADTLGTPHYMAPEQVRQAPLDHRIDIYALGCAAYRMVCGEFPVDGPDPQTVAEAQLDHIPQPPSTFADVPASLERAIMRCLEKHPDDRFSSMAEFEAALCEAQIELGITTAWDDLPLPDIDPERRAAILVAMPDPVAEHARRRQRYIIGGLTAATLLSTGAYLVAVADPSPEEINAVEELRYEARAAAAKAHFVYPSTDAPGEPTAYMKVLELEEIEGDAEDIADEAASELRVEFAHTLTNLGNEYWDREFGKTFAIDYYAQAVVFVPEFDTASERAVLSPGQLAELQRKAENAEFSELELAAVEPLTVLAERDPQRRLARWKALRSKPSVRASHVEAGLEALFGGTAKPSPKVASAGGAQDSPESSGEEPPTPTIPESDDPHSERETPAEVAVADPVSPARGSTRRGAARSDSSAGKTSKRTRRDRSRSNALVKDARSARSRGNSKQAEAMYREALAADSSNADALAGLSDLYFDRNQHRQAARFARKAVSLAPNNAGHRIRLGDAYFNLLQYTKAKEQYEQAKLLGHSGAARRLRKVGPLVGRGK